MPRNSSRSSLNEYLPKYLTKSQTSRLESRNTRKAHSRKDKNCQMPRDKFKADARMAFVLYGTISESIKGGRMFDTVFDIYQL